MDAGAPQTNTAAGFTAASNRALRAAGLVGDTVQVAYADRVLSLAGSTSGSLRILASATERLRLGYFQGKYRRVFTASITLMGQQKPLVLEPVADDARAYGEAMRGFAQAVASARGIGQVETGLGGATAVLMLALLMLPPAALCYVAFAFVPGTNWPLRAGMLAMGAALAAIGVWLYFKRQKPKGVESLEMLEPQLPDPVSGV